MNKEIKRKPSELSGSKERNEVSYLSKIYIAPYI